MRVDNYSKVINDLDAKLKPYAWYKRCHFRVSKGKDTKIIVWVRNFNLDIDAMIPKKIDKYPVEVLVLSNKVGA